MKFVAIINLKKTKPEDRVVAFITDDPGPPPPVIDPPDADEPKDGGIVKDKPGTLNNEKPN